ncbi:peroxisomal N(1)-acetyl-spermine/spermidine oxidase isoform X1 [Drosophila takahashii]|uniref:peroxisomal N(1)-acetyl-spermine/spermidine oxidase isoform X1 n=1 Tax=Drosophila takahashii TaxID=29030 RepID=UPI001CF8D09C|nr:spermine oxidase [Drosophila takahashii]
MEKCPASSRILIVGAGASGIAAATRLLENNFGNVQILEAENRIGGRIQTICFGDNVVDVGAQWCHGKQRNCVYEMVKDMGVVQDTGDFFAGIKRVRSNKEVVPHDLACSLTDISMGSMPSGPQPVAGSFGTHLAENFWRNIEQQLPQVDRILASEALEAFTKHESSIIGADSLFEVSGREHIEYDKCDGEMLIHWGTKGFQRFLRLLMKVSEETPEELGLLQGRVHLGKKVTKIDCLTSPGKVILRCEDGDYFDADHVICTVSLGVLQEQHEKLFIPPLPAAKVNAIRGLTLGTVNKMYLEFEEQPLPDDWVGFFCFWLAEDLKELRKTEYFWLEGITGIHRVTCQPRLLMAWVGGALGRHMETLTDEKVLEGLQWLFRKFLTFEIPEPKRFIRSKWFSNPNFRGTWTFRPTKADERDTGPWDLESPVLGEDGHLGLLFAGEASSRNHFSTVHGAVEAGWREADRLIRHYSSCGPRS